MPRTARPNDWPRDPDVAFERITYARARVQGLRLTRWGRDLAREIDAITGTVDDAIAGYSVIAERLRAQLAESDRDDALAEQHGVPSDLAVVPQSTSQGPRDTSHRVCFNRSIQRREFLAWLKRERWLGFHPAGYVGGIAVTENVGIYSHSNTSD